jgi:hypothetical protein
VITEKWKSLPEDAKLVFKRKAKKNSEKYRIKKANIKNMLFINQFVTTP